MDFDSLRWDFSLLVLFICASVQVFRRYYGDDTKIPRLNDRRPWEFSRKAAATRYTFDSWNMFHQGLDRFGETPFRISSLDRGESVVLPHRFVAQVAADPRLHFAALVSATAHGHLKTFSLFAFLGAQTAIVRLILRQSMTRSLASLVAPLSKQADRAFRNWIPQDTNIWGEVELTQLGLRVVSRLSTRAIEGEERCDDDSWTDLLVEFTVKIRAAIQALRLLPKFPRPLAELLHPACRAVRKMRKRAADVILGDFEKHRKARSAGPGAHDEVQSHTVLSWYEDNLSHPGNEEEAVNAMLLIFFGSILTTTDLFCQVVLDLAQHRELTQPLRDEIASVITSNGWKKQSMFKLTRLDSVIKESQRLKPVQIGLMERLVTEDMALIDPETKESVELNRGETVMVSPKIMRDPSVYQDPNIYDGFRFHKLRFGGVNGDAQAQQPHVEEQHENHETHESVGEDKSESITPLSSPHQMWQLTSSPNDHLAFGVGPHACPGRFFVGSELKIALCHLIMKYDWKLASEKLPQPFSMGNIRLFDMQAKILVKRRDVELVW